MKNNLKVNKFSLLSHEDRKEICDFILKEHDSFLYVGMVFYNDSYNTFGTITDIYKQKEKIYVEYILENQYEDDKKRTETLHDFYSYNHNHAILTTKEEFKKHVDALIKNEITLDELVADYFGKNESDSTELMTTNKNMVVDRRNELIQKREFVAARYKHMEMLLDAKKRELYKMVDGFKHQIKKVNKLIIQLELYLGVEETIEQIQVGIPADLNIPISLRQRILYMDIEVGDPSDGGLDIDSIEKFDEWLLKFHSYWKKKNYEILIPEEKCIAIFRIRKDDKRYNYSSNPFLNALFSAKKNEENMNTYIFMRNGENIYKIWSKLINIQNRLFPRKAELQELLDEMAKYEDSYTGQRAEDTLHDYKLHFLLLQGIFERTNVFENSNEINLFNSNVDISEKVNYIYDDDIATQLPSNIIPFGQWQKKLNESISEGSRIYFIGSGFKRLFSGEKSEIKDRLFKQFFYNDSAYPDYGPDSGVYTVYEETDKAYVGKPTLYIKYMYKKRWASDESRGKGFSFSIFKDDDFIINYDAIGHKDLETLEFYMYTRIGREKYLSYIPILMEVYNQRKAELALEKEFIKLVMATNKIEFNESNEMFVLQLIDWWKLKNKWKRSLNVDNTKALRMISKEIKNHTEIVNEIMQNLEKNGY